MQRSDTTILTIIKVIANSRFVAGLLPEGVKSKTSTLYPSVDTSIISQLPTSRTASKERQILFVGRPVAKKGSDILLNLFSELITEMSDE